MVQSPASVLSGADRAGAAAYGSLLVVFVAIILPQAVGGVTFNYRGGVNSTCPCISVSTSNLSALVNVTVTSSMKSAGGSNNSSSRYCSTALASSSTMNSTIAVFDCYELGGNVTVGASRNLVNGTVRDNVDDPLLRGNLRNVMARKENATLVCSLTFNASALVSPGLNKLFILLAEGALSNASSPSTPKKSMHTWRAALPANDLLQSLAPSGSQSSTSGSQSSTPGSQSSQASSQPGSQSSLSSSQPGNQSSLSSSSASSPTVAAGRATTANSRASSSDGQVAVILAVILQVGVSAFVGFKAPTAAT